VIHDFAVLSERWSCDFGPGVYSDSIFFAR
jgi:hypothetical protein